MVAPVFGSRYHSTCSIGRFPGARVKISWSLLKGPLAALVGIGGLVGAGVAVLAGVTAGAGVGARAATGETASAFTGADAGDGAVFARAGTGATEVWR